MMQEFETTIITIIITIVIIIVIGPHQIEGILARFLLYAKKHDT